MNIQQQFMQDAQTAANNMMVQQMCLQQGIDYGALMQVAQQQQINNIMKAEQQRVQSEIIKRYYGGGEQQGMFGKIKEAIVGKEESPMMNPMNPMGMNMPGMPIGMPMQPIIQQVGMIPPMGMPMPTPSMPVHVGEVVEQSAPKHNEVDALKKEVGEMKEMFAQLMAMQVQQQATQPSKGMAGLVQKKHME